MYVKRYLVLLSDTNEYPNILELPHETIQSAWEALKAEFERVVRAVCDGNGEVDHVIEYENEEASCYDDHLDYELRKDGPDGPCFYVWDGEDITYKGVIREISIHCTETEIERGYRENERKYLLMDAENHLYESLGVVDDSDNEAAGKAWNESVYQRFREDCGFSLEEAACEGSAFFILDDMVNLFERKRDCNIPENDVWDTVVSAVLGRIKAEHKRDKKGDRNV